jgi:hypothetical protein
MAQQGVSPQPRADKEPKRTNDKHNNRRKKDPTSPEKEKRRDKTTNGVKAAESKVRDANKNLYLKYKTAICRHYEQTGTCQLGKMCNFAHGSEEKRNMNDVSLSPPNSLCSRSRKPSQASNSSASFTATTRRNFARTSR